MTEDILYIGEQLLPGKLGHFLIILAFVSALMAGIAYYRAWKLESKSWNRLARAGFTSFSLATLGVIAIIIYLIINHRYEYTYIYDRVSDVLPFKYVFTAFWTGQAGSFLLWIFWHIVLSYVVILKIKKWEAPVMMTISLFMAFLMSMLLGVILIDGEEAIRLGLHPFSLLRDDIAAPIFSQPDYLSKIEGRGLNPLLQNYWNTIHPPVMFLGFASATFPFAFAMAGLIKRKHKEVIRPMIKWALCTSFFLGVGLLMGSAWAYEALSFGGYWAWDPVENTSLVPWLLVIAGLHLNLISKSTGRHIKSTYVLYILTFLAVLYSSILTRSGILTESAHSFVDEGLGAQLYTLFGFFLVYALFHYFRGKKSIPGKDKEEPIWSREFWMFIGALVFILSSFLILFTTSLPIYNQVISAIGELFGQNWDHLHRAAPTDVIAHYNKYQIWVAILIGFLSSWAHFLRYGDDKAIANRKRAWMTLLVTLGISLLGTFLLNLWIKTPSWPFTLMLFTSVFAVVAAISIFIRLLRLQSSEVGSLLGHAGFGIMCLGILASGLNKRHISSEPFLMRELFADDEMLQKNVMLLKNSPLITQDYRVTYQKDTIEGNLRYYDLLFEKMDSSRTKVVESFQVRPSAIFNIDFTKVAAFNPDTKHYWDRDIFTSIPSIPPSEGDAEAAKAVEDSLVYNLFKLRKSDTLYTKSHFGIIKGITYQPSHEDYRPIPGDKAVGLNMTLHSLINTDSINIQPMIAIRPGSRSYLNFPVKVNEAGIKIKLADEWLAKLYPADEELVYKRYVLKQGESINIGNEQLTFGGLSKEVSHEEYDSEEGDIAVQANLVVNAGGDARNITPVYVIRGNRPFFIRDYDAPSKLAVRLEKIDPKTQEMTFGIAQNTNTTADQFDVAMAENVPRNDYVILEAIIFPGINLFWLGGILMMLGFFVSYWLKHRRRESLGA